MKTTSDFLANLEGSDELKKKLSKAQSADELLKVATDAGYHVNTNTVSEAMRAVAGAELQKRGLPDWAINSLFLGESVCW